jgi:adenosine deaminase
VDSPDTDRWQVELDWLQRLPKLELHLHLEGAIPLPTLWELISKYGGDPSLPDLHALEDRFRYRDFDHFLRTWGWKNGYLREYDDFTLIAEAVARDLADQRIVYAEVFYSPADFSSQNLEPQRLTEAIRGGLDRVAEIEVALVADMVRDHGPQSGARTLSAVNEVRDLGVVGIGIGGSERQYPPELFAQVYERARELGFRTSAHAGEGAGPESVWGAIHSLHVDRIGHGTRAVEDDALVRYLAEHRVPLEVCPISNLRTGVVVALEEHPVRVFVERGVPVTIASDDPAMFNTSLAAELLALERDLAFDRDRIRRLILEAVAVSWLDEERKTELETLLISDPAWHESPI